MTKSGFDSCFVPGTYVVGLSKTSRNNQSNFTHDLAERYGAKSVGKVKIRMVASNGRLGDEEFGEGRPSLSSRRCARLLGPRVIAIRTLIKAGEVVHMKRQFTSVCRARI
jgi:hypothetical protein